MSLCRWYFVVSLLWRYWWCSQPHEEGIKSTSCRWLAICHALRRIIRDGDGRRGDGGRVAAKYVRDGGVGAAMLQRREIEPSKIIRRGIAGTGRRTYEAGEKMGNRMPK